MFRETVWLESDRHLFLPGETIKFRARVLEQDSYNASSFSKNLRVELLDSEGKAVSQQNLRLTDAELMGKVQIPDDAISGWYYLRAYTNWMRNFPQSNFGFLPVKLINPAEIDVNAMQLEDNKIVISLYPASGETGIFAGFNGLQGLKVSGWILSEQGDTLAPFATHESGWGHIMIGLIANQSYQVILDSPTTNYQHKAHVLSTDGPIMLIQNGEENITVTFPKLPIAIREDMRLILHQSYTVYWETSSTEKIGMEFQIPKDKLPSGVFQISLLGADNKILAKRLWSTFRPEPNNISLVAQDHLLKIRDSITLSYKVNKDPKSLSVFIGLQEPGHPLESFIAGMPGWSCNTQIPNNYQAFKGWLMGNSYADDLVSLLANQNNNTHQNPVLEHFPETRSGVIYGRVIDKNTGSGVSQTGICLTILNDNYFDATNTDSSGQFYFALPGYSRSLDYITNLTSGLDSSLQILVTPTYHTASGTFNDNFYLTESELDYIRNQGINLQLQEIFGNYPEASYPSTDTLIQKNAFFHAPDFKIVVGNFIKLANVKEVIYEVVPNVSVRKKDGKEYLKVYNDHPFSASYETLVLLDGIPVSDQKKLLELPPDRIELIEVKNKMYIHGRTIFSSIVNFVSPNKDYAGLELPDNSILSTLELPVQTLLESFNATTSEANTPDLETTLLWSGLLVSTQGAILLKSNDRIGIFNILVYGFDKQGRWISGKQALQVEQEN